MKATEMLADSGSSARRIGSTRPNRLGDQAPQFIKCWALRIGLVVFLIPDSSRRYPTCFFQATKLTMHGARAAIGKADEFSTLESALGLTEQKSKHLQLHGREQRSSKARRSVCE